MNDRAIQLAYWTFSAFFWLVYLVCCWYRDIPFPWWCFTSFDDGFDGKEREW